MYVLDSVFTNFLPYFLRVVLDHYLSLNLTLLQPPALHKTASSHPLTLPTSYLLLNIIVHNHHIWGYWWSNHFFARVKQMNSLLTGIIDCILTCEVFRMAQCRGSRFTKPILRPLARSPISMLTVALAMKCTNKMW